MEKGTRIKEFMNTELPPGPHWIQTEVPIMVIDCKYYLVPLIPQPRLNRVKPAARANCVLIIDLTKDDPVRLSYQSVWRAAVAVDAMCVRRGLAGWIGPLGDGYRNLFVSIENGHNPLHLVLGSPATSSVTTA